MSGFYNDRFSKVQEEFERNLSERGDIGASFACTIDGEFVIDLWGGYKDVDKSQPWEEDTICNVYSTSKTMTFISALVLADRGELDLHAPVAKYWPEFGVNGKKNIRVSQILCHAAGLPGMSRVFELEEMYDWDSVCDDLAAQSPWWEPGTQSGYHATTQGFLIGEIIRRITGQSMGNFFRENVAEPMQADFHIGMDPSVFPRVSDLHPDPASGGGGLLQTDPDTMAGRVFGSTHMPEGSVNSEAWRMAELPAVNGHGNARSVVRAQTALANDGYAFGVQLLSAQGCARAREVQIESTDAVLGFPIKFAMGYAYGNPMLPITPNANAIWWAGAGGSTIVIDEDHRMCFSYVMNQTKAAMVGDERSGKMTEALYAAL
jgi:CubicO group peptidase (beta-lactamase class C family)